MGVLYHHSKFRQRVPLLELSTLEAKASAGSCDKDCGGECTGGCEIDSMDCSTLCVGGGCPGDVTCYEYGGTSLTCHKSATYSCVEPSEGDGKPGGPDTQNLRVMPQTEWAVLKFRTDEVHPVNEAQVQLIAASTPRYGGLAVDKLVSSTHEAFELRTKVRDRGLNRGDTAVPSLPQSPPVVERVRFMVDAVGSCEKVGLLVPREAPARVRGSAFFRVIAGADGEVSAVSPLYVEPETNLEALSSFLRQRGRLVMTSDSPIEAYLYLRANDSGVSYIIGSGTKLF